jgi:hypothetical protein
VATRSGRWAPAASPLRGRRGISRLPSSSVGGPPASFCDATLADPAVLPINLDPKTDWQALGCQPRGWQAVQVHNENSLAMIAHSAWTSESADIATIYDSEHESPAVGGTSLSQSEFARLIGASVKTLQNWEQDRRRPTGPPAAQTRPDLVYVIIRLWWCAIFPKRRPSFRR